MMNDTTHTTLTYSEHERSLMLLILVTLSVVAVLGNSAQFLAIYLESSLQTASNIFIISLGCSDLGVGLITLPTVAFTVYHRGWVLNDILCKVAGLTDSLMITASMWTLGFTALDRFFLVQSPIAHRNTMTKAIARRTVMFCWGLSFATAILPVLGWSDYTFSAHSMSCAMTFVRGFNTIHKYYFLFYVMVSFPLPLIMIMVCYVLIFKYSVCIKPQRISPPKVCNGSGCKPLVYVSNFRTAKITLLLIVFVLACILPTFVLGMVFWGEKDLPQVFVSKISLLSKVVIWSLLGNSACNPILYGWFNKHFRSVYQQMFLSVILRERYSLLRRSVLSMRSIQGTPKQQMSFNNNPMTIDVEVMNIMTPSFGNSLKKIKKYNIKLNREPRGTMPTVGIAMQFCCAPDRFSVAASSIRRHSLAGGEVSTNRVISIPANHRYSSQPNVTNDWTCTTTTLHK